MAIGYTGIARCALKVKMNIHLVLMSLSTKFLDSISNSMSANQYCIHHIYCYDETKLSSADSEKRHQIRNVCNTQNPGQFGWKLIN